MKFKLSIFLLIFLISSQLSAQKCKYQIDETDPFSDQIRREIHKVELITYNKYRDMIVEANPEMVRLGDEITIRMGYVFQGEQNIRLTKRDKLLLKLENGETLELIPINESNPETYVVASGVKTRFRVSYEIDSATLELLTMHLITHAKINFGNTETTLEVKGKNAEKFKFSVTCISE